MADTYSIRDWDRHFENSNSRKVDHCRYAYTPNKQGRGYRRTLRRNDGEALFGAWNAILQLASRMPKRGLLVDEDGPMSVADISDLTLFKQETIQTAMDWFSSEEMGWIAVIHENKALERDEPGNNPGSLPEGTGEAGDFLHRREGKGIEEKGIKIHTLKFPEFWEAYPTRNGKKVGKKTAGVLFSRIPEEFLDQVIRNAKNYGVGNDFPKDPERFLKNDFWKEWDEPMRNGKSMNGKNHVPDFVGVGK